MHYIVIDLEMCRVPKSYKTKSYRHNHEIIEIGTAVYNDRWELERTRKDYVRPEYGVIDGFIERLTGIRNYHVKNAPVLSDTLDSLIDWFQDDEYIIYTWSRSDRDQLAMEIASKNIESQKVISFMEEDRWIDYQEIYDDRFYFDRQVSLEDALSSLEIETVGNAHDGLDDAINTGELIRTLELNEDMELSYYSYIDECENSLNFSLGDIFAGLVSQSA